MSKKNRKQATARRMERPQPQPEQPAGVTIRNDTPSAETQGNAVDSPKPAKQPTNWAAWLAIVISLLSAGIAAYNARISANNATITAENAKVAKSNYDRLAGHVRAKFVITDILPEQKDVPPQLLEHSDIFDAPGLTLHEPDDFFRLSPQVVIKNTGDEPISEVRIETRLGFSFIDMREQPAERQRQLTPWGFEDAIREDYVLSEKLLPGKSVAVSITKGLLRQMIQLQANDRGDRWHYGRFDIRCMAKLVNGAAFDAPEDDGGIRINYRWKPKDFPEDKCKAMIEKLKHTPVVVD